MEENRMSNYVPEQMNTGNPPDPNKEVMSMGSWLITLIVLAIPCVGIIMYFVWAFGNGNENRKNFCRAGLIMMAICLVLTFVFYGIIGAAIASSF